MALKLITPPQPIFSIDYAKRHLHYEDNDQDEYIADLIEAATRHIDGREGWLNRALKPQTYDLVYDSFPCGPIEIPLPPLISIDSLNYVDQDGAPQVFSSGSYEVDNFSEPGWLQLGSSFSWPSVMSTINAVRVRFTAGYADSTATTPPETTVPWPIRQAIMIMVGDMFKYRESVTEGLLSAIPIQSSVKALLHPYRIFA